MLDTGCVLRTCACAVLKLNNLLKQLLNLLLRCAGSGCCAGPEGPRAWAVLGAGGQGSRTEAAATPTKAQAAKPACERAHIARVLILRGPWGAKG